MLDHDGDNTVRHEEFVLSFCRLVDSISFQQLCLMQTGINSIKRRFQQSDTFCRNQFLKIERELSRVLKELRHISRDSIEQTSESSRRASDATACSDNFDIMALLRPLSPNSSEFSSAAKRAATLALELVADEQRLATSNEASVYRPEVQWSVELPISEERMQEDLQPLKGREGPGVRFVPGPPARPLLGDDVACQMTVPQLRTRAEVEPPNKLAATAGDSNTGGCTM